jgi:hypothetical protein
MMVTSPHPDTSSSVPVSDILDEIDYQPTDRPYLYTCTRLERDTGLPLIICLTGTTAGGKDTLMRALIE